MYVIEGHSGEWEDSFSWYAATEDDKTIAYMSEEAAQQHCDRLNLIIESIEDFDTLLLSSEDNLMGNADEFTFYMVKEIIFEYLLI